MKTRCLFAAIALGITTLSATAGECPPQTSSTAALAFNQKVRVTTQTIGAINRDTYKVLADLLNKDSLANLKKKDDPTLAKLYEQHLVQEIQGGRVVCASTPGSFFDYATQVYLDDEGFAVWMRDKDFVKFD